MSRIKVKCICHSKLEKCNKCDSERKRVFKTNLKQENKMQQFENGARVTITYAEDGTTRDCKHVGMNGLLHVVDLGSSMFCEFGDNYIKPRQLICDKAREKIKYFLTETDGFKVKLENHDMLAELSEATRYTYTDTMISNLLFFNSNQSKEIGHCSNDIEFFNNSIFPELNLKTGEVVECEEDANFNMEVARTIVKDLRNALKEKDAEIAGLKEGNKFLSEKLKESSDKTIYLAQKFSESMKIGADAIQKVTSN